MARILYITPDLPYFPGGHGGNIREYNLLRQLAGRHSFSVVALRRTTPERVARLNEMGIAVLHAPPDEVPLDHRLAGMPVIGIGYRLLRFLWRRAYLSNSRNLPPVSARLLREFEKAVGKISLDDYDLVQVEHTYLLPVAERLKRMPNCPPVIVTAHNVESLLGKRISAIQGGSLARRNEELAAVQSAHMEKRSFHLADWVVAMSDVDADWMSANLPVSGRNLVVVPNGVDCGYFSERLASPIKNRIVFTGTLDYPPNREAVSWFREAVLPDLVKAVQGIEFHVAGSYCDGFPEINRARFPQNESYAFNVPDIRPHIQSASVYVVPLLAESGTRLKIFEAMACGCAVVSTRVGAEGIPAVDGETILLADGADEMTSRILQLLANEDQQSAIGMRAREWVRSAFDWSKIAGVQDDVYARALSPGVAGR